LKVDQAWQGIAGKRELALFVVDLQTRVGEQRWVNK